MPFFEYSFLGLTFLIGVVLLLICVLCLAIWQPTKFGYGILGRNFGCVQHDRLGWFETAGVITVLVFYLCQWVVAGVPDKPPRVTIAYLVGQTVLQFAFMLTICVVLARRVSLSKIWGLKVRRYYFAMLVGAAGFLLHTLLLEILWHLGIEKHAKLLFPVDMASVPRLIVYDAKKFWGVWAFLIVFVVPVTEEVVFRGFLYPVLKRSGGPLLAAMTVSVFFAVGHLDGRNLLPHFFLSLILIASYEMTGSLWAPIGIHILNNGLVFAEDVLHF